MEKVTLVQGQKLQATDRSAEYIVQAVVGNVFFVSKDRPGSPVLGPYTIDPLPSGFVFPTPESDQWVDSYGDVNKVFRDGLNVRMEYTERDNVDSEDWIDGGGLYSDQLIKCLGERILDLKKQLAESEARFDKRPRPLTPNG